MRSSFFTLAALAIGVISTPLAPRADFDALTLVNDLSAAFAAPLASITTATSGIDATSTDEEKAAASSSIASDISTLVGIVTDATAQVPTTATSRKLAVRQTDAAGVGAALTALLGTLSTAVDGIVSALGLTSALSLLNPLTSALSNLLLALEVVVDDLLAVVKQLVDSLLTGLSIGLAGLIL